MREEYDYVFVGSGVSATTVAMELLESDRSLRILVLEAGSRIPRQDRRYWWDYATFSAFDTADLKPEDKYLPYSWSYDQKGEYQSSGNPGWYFGDSRNLAYGGSTMHWGGWSLRFKPEDFEMFSRTKTGADWPVSYKQLESYYCKAEDYLSVGGDSTENWGTAEVPMCRSKPYPLPPFPWSAPETAMAAAFERFGVKPGYMPLSRYRKCMTTGTCKYCPLGSRYSADEVLDQLVGDPRNGGLQVKWNSPATAIICDAKERVRGVEYVDNSTGLVRTADASVVIVAAGTLESPKLLQMSRSKFWEKGIGNDHGNVGRYLVSHSQLKVLGKRQGNAERWFQEYDFPTLMSRTWDTPEFQEGGKLFLYNNRKLPNFDFAAMMVAGKSRVDIEAAFTKKRQIQLEAFYEDKGQHKNFVACHPTRRTRFGLPMTIVHFDRSTAAEVAIKVWLGKMRQIVESMGYEIESSKADPPGGHHASGTCRMGVSPVDSVTDADMKVHGVDNLYVCSNAVFPTSSAVNPTLTLVALAFRLSEHLVSRAAHRASNA